MHHHLFVFFYLLVLSLILLFPVHTQTAFLTPIFKDQATLQYSLSLYLKTPLQSTKLHLDLGSSFTYIDCYDDYTSSTYKHVPCNSSLCNSIHYSLPLPCSPTCFHAPAPACANDSCGLYPENPVTRQTALSNALVDSLALPSPSRQGLGLIPEFIFSCADTLLLKGLPKDVVGSAALGRSNYSLQAQVSDALSVSSYFALCLSGSTSGPGVGFFGSSGPYNFSLGQIDLSKSLSYTPLIFNPVGSTVITYTGQPSAEYYIGLNSIKVNGKDVPINGSVLAIDENGFGGTKISTVNPYTAMESSIYKVFTDAFVNESAGLNLTVTNAVRPFTVCYPAGDLISTRVGPAVPTVDLVMQNDGAFWRIFGSNSMVMVVENGVDLWCLGFVDGGVNARTSVVIGGHQMEDNLLQFDLESKRLGFSSSVLLQGTTCANFSFTGQT